VSERGRESVCAKRVFVCMCVFERERECVSVCVKERECAKDLGNTKKGVYMLFIGHLP